MNPLQRIGELIKAAREEKDLSIQDLAGSLRIGQEQLIALENGEEELLPEKVFIKAMIRRVAERLHLDIGILINEFQTEGKSPESITKRQSIDLPKIKSLGKIPNLALLAGAISITILGLAVTYLKDNSSQSIKKDSSPPKLLDPKRKAVNSSYHIVAPGQTLSRISKFHEIPLQTLININQLNNPDKLKIGTKLTLIKKQKEITN